MARVVVDKILGKPLLHDHADKLDLSGGVLTGTLEFPSSGFIMNCGSTRYYVTIDCSGALVTTPIASTAGTPMGLLLALTRST